MSETLLRTKLFVPPLRPFLVPRPHLIEKLNQGLQQGSKLTLISAPAGFGKTTLVSEWVGNLRPDTAKQSQNVNRSAWLSLDESDNDLARFLAYFITALNRVEGTQIPVGERALTMLQSPQPPPAETVLTALINEMVAIPDRIVLVLDDYHLIDAPPIRAALSFLLENQPPRFHLVIATREDPHLPLSRLRARGQLTELRAADLRFTSSEAAQFLNQVMGLDLSTEDVAVLERRTEGWIAGLQLAAISVQGQEDTTSFIKSFSGSHRLVLDYLIEEVLDQQPRDIQAFLLQTAVLSRLTGSLCDALTGRDNGRETLEILERGNLFVVPLDEERQWYRYHHLFADLLRQRLRQAHLELIPTLHSRASDWYAQKELPVDAIRHALAAQDFERAAGLAELAWPTMSGNYQSFTWFRCVQALPDELIRTRPVLSVAYAQALLNTGNLEAAEARLLEVERMLDPADGKTGQPEVPSIEFVVVDKVQFQSLPVSIATARAYHAQAIGDLSGTVKYAQQVLDLVPEEDNPWRGAASSLLGLAQYANGDLEAAYESFSAGLNDVEPLDAITGTFVLADIQTVLGRLQTAVNLCEHALRLATAYGEQMPLGTEDVYIGISKLHRERGDLEAAAQDLLTGKQLGEQVEVPDWQHRWCIAQARLTETRGDLEGALELLDEAERLFVRTPVPDVRPIAAAKARIWVKQDKLAKALAWVDEQKLSVDDDLSFLREFEHVTLAQVLIAQHKRDRAERPIQEALELIERLLQAAETGRRTGSVIEILVLQALAYQVKGDTASALIALERALVLAEPEGYHRMFVDEGPPMARLLYEALSRGNVQNYVKQLLGALPITKPEQAGTYQTQASESEWVEALSEREIEVLNLIAAGLTNQEIATRLYLSLHTVKVHARNIYGKLGVKNRIQAVARGKALGILSQPN